MQTLEQIEYHLDAVAGAQAAMFAAIGYLLSVHKGNPQATAAVASALEQMKAGLIASVATDYKIHSFDEMAETLLEILS